MIERGLKFLLVLNLGFLALTLLARFQAANVAPLLNVDPAALFLAVALPAVLLSLFSDTCVLFYFIGTAVWIRDRGDEILRTNRNRAKQIQGIFESANALKGKSFPFATLGIALALFFLILSGGIQVGAVSNWLGTILCLAWAANAAASIKFIFPAIQTNLEYLDEASRLVNDENNAIGARP